MNDFKYYSIKELLPYVGKEVEWITLSNGIKKATLQLDKNRPYLPESGGVWADTVKIKL